MGCSRNVSVCVMGRVSTGTVRLMIRTTAGKTVRAGAIRGDIQGDQAVETYSKTEYMC